MFVVLLRKEISLSPVPILEELKSKLGTLEGFSRALIESGLLMSAIACDYYCV